MANYCWYNACVKGKPDIVDKVVNYMIDHSYDGDPEVGIISSGENDGVKMVSINGGCKWSVFTAFNIEKHITPNIIYSVEVDDDPKTKKMIDLANKLHEEHMNSESLLDIRGDTDDDYKIEIFSEEPSMGFAEHYILSAGKIILDDCRHFYEAFDEETETSTFNGGFEYYSFSFDPTYVIPEYKEFTVKNEDS